MKQIMREYLDCMRGLRENSKVARMKQFTQHGKTTCYEHCSHVSYYSYRVCRRLRLDYRAAARAGMLHDFFLYDWHVDRPAEGLHAFCHAGIALRNAEQSFTLSAKERDIIAKHMFPLSPPPRCLEAFVVSCVDKFCSLAETSRLRGLLACEGILDGRGGPFY